MVNEGSKVKGKRALAEPSRLPKGLQGLAAAIEKFYQVENVFNWVKIRVSITIFK